MQRNDLTVSRLRHLAIRLVECQLTFIPVQTRVPLKFGTETLTAVTCARVCITVECADGRQVNGWGETPLSVQWVWPGSLPYEGRHHALKRFCEILANAWLDCGFSGHAMEVGHAFQEQVLPALLDRFNRDRERSEAMPYLAALLCCSAFDLALHDAGGCALHRPTYETYTSDYLSQDLSHYLEAAEGSGVSFAGKFPAEFLVKAPPKLLPAWHLVGALDPLESSELRGCEPDDGYPVLLGDWIRRDGLTCLKIKLCGTDGAWDLDRLIRVGRIALARGVRRLSADFNCMVTEAQYVRDILDRLREEQSGIYEMLLYVEQPFPYDLEAHRIDVYALSAIKPLFMDESAHDWRMVRLGRSLGWNGVALKTCKTQSGALLSLAWARAHGMRVMVQDLSNPMLAMIPHALLAAHAGTIYGVETNAPQFYPEASQAEARVHPGLYTRKHGMIDLSTMRGNGFGYRMDEMDVR